MRLPAEFFHNHCVNRAAPGTALHKGGLTGSISGASGITGNSKWDACFGSWKTEITFFAGDKGVSTYLDEASQVEKSASSLEIFSHILHPFLNVLNIGWSSI